MAVEAVPHQRHGHRPELLAPILRHGPDRAGETHAHRVVTGHHLRQRCHDPERVELLLFLHRFATAGAHEQAVVPGDDVQALQPRRHRGKHRPKSHGPQGEIDERQRPVGLQHGKCLGPRLSGAGGRRKRPERHPLVAGGIEPLQAHRIRVRRRRDRHEAAAAHGHPDLLRGQRALPHEPTIGRRQHRRLFAVARTQAEKFVVTDELADGRQPMPLPEQRAARRVAQLHRLLDDGRQPFRHQEHAADRRVHRGHLGLGHPNAERHVAVAFCAGRTTAQMDPECRELGRAAGGVGERPETCGRRAVGAADIEGGEGATRPHHEHGPEGGRLGMERLKDRIEPADSPGIEGDRLAQPASQAVGEDQRGRLHVAADLQPRHDAPRTGIDGNGDDPRHPHHLLRLEPPASVRGHPAQRPGSINQRRQRGRRQAHPSRSRGRAQPQHVATDGRRSQRIASLCSGGLSRVEHLEHSLAGGGAARVPTEHRLDALERRPPVGPLGPNGNVERRSDECIDLPTHLGRSPLEKVADAALQPAGLSDHERRVGHVFDQPVVVALMCRGQVEQASARTPRFGNRAGGELIVDRNAEQGLGMRQRTGRVDDLAPQWRRRGKVAPHAEQERVGDQVGRDALRLRPPGCGNRAEAVGHAAPIEVELSPPHERPGIHRTIRRRLDPTLERHHLMEHVERIDTL